MEEKNVLTNQVQVLQFDVNVEELEVKETPAIISNHGGSRSETCWVRAASALKGIAMVLSSEAVISLEHAD